MHSILLVDGHDPSEPPVIQLLAHMVERSKKFYEFVQFRPVGREPWPEPSEGRWSVIWFAGHSSVYKKRNEGFLERREGRGYTRLKSAQEVRALDAQLVVLASCYTSPYVGPFAHPESVTVGYDGALHLNDSLLFAARFFSMLEACCWKNRMTDAQVTDAFNASKLYFADRRAGGWQIG